MAMRRGKLTVLLFVSPADPGGLEHLRLLCRAVGSAGADAAAAALMVGDLAEARALADRLEPELKLSLGHDAKLETLRSYTQDLGEPWLPLAFIVDRDLRAVWHGHPKAGLESAFAEVVAGTFDVRRFRLDFLSGRDPNLARLPGARKLASGAAAGGSWSPDGRRIAFTKQGGQGIAVLDVETGRTTDLVAPGHSPRWSPDGTRIAYQTGKRALSQGLEVRVLDVSGGTSRKVLDPTSFLDWSPDGKMLRVYRSEDRQILELPMDGDRSEGRLLFQLPGTEGSLYHPILSPDSKLVLFAEFRDGGASDCVIWDRDSGAEVFRWRLPGPVANFGGSLWLSPAAKSFVLVTGGFLDFGIWNVSVPGGEAYPVIRGVYVTASWSPDGSTLSFVAPDETGVWGEIWALDARAVAELRAIRLADSGQIAPR